MECSEVGVEYVVVRLTADGYWLDPSAYLEQLPSLEEHLPRGALEFAMDADHYDFYSDRCVKDLAFRSLAADDPRGSLRLELAPNEFKHSVGLTLTYSRLASVTPGPVREPEAAGFGTVLLDELLPAPQGVTHEIAFTEGTLRIVAADVRAVWEIASC